MAAQNFKIKNGLTVGSTEVIDSSGDLTAAALGDFQQLNNTTAPMHHKIVVTVSGNLGFVTFWEVMCAHIMISSLSCCCSQNVMS